MAKPLLGLIAAVAVSTSLAACGSHEQEAAATPSPAAQAPQPVTPPTPAPQAMSAPRVDVVQRALNADGAHPTVDGRVGPKTEAALRKFQQRHSLLVTARPDSATISALGIPCC